MPVFEQYAGEVDISLVKLRADVQRARDVRHLKLGLGDCGGRLANVL